MAFHELATNAVRHGALSAPAGKVEITWSADRLADPAQLLLRWRESGGPIVSPPTEKGFGVRLIERSLAASVGGVSSLAFEPDGFVFQLSAPISAAIALP
jgi:two-component sensor histidine kinase